MTLRIVCDRLMCGRYEDTRFGEPPDTWVTVSRDEQSHRDSSRRSSYCSLRCAVLALGGDWAEGTSRVIEDDAIADDEADRFLDAMQGVRTIPWPPSEELKAAIETAVADVIEVDVARGDYCCGEPGESVGRIVGAVLSVIGGEA